MVIRMLFGYVCFIETRKNIGENMVYDLQTLGNRDINPPNTKYKTSRSLLTPF